VICGHAGERLQLFDSDGLKWLAVDGVSLDQDGKRRHWIAPESTYALIRVPGEPNFLVTRSRRGTPPGNSA
jgi:hypothetical protein